MKNNESGFALIWSYLVTASLVVMAGSFYSTSNNDLTMTIKSSSSIQAFFLAESGIDKKLVELEDGNANNISSTTYGGGTYQVTYDSTNSIITSVGTFGGVSRTVTAAVEVPGDDIPPGVKASLTVPSQVVVILGMTIDGREHDTQGNLTGDPGTYGMAYGAEPSFDGWVYPKIGGNGYVPDQAPVPAEAKYDMDAEESADAATPEAVLGLPAGSTLLNQYKSTSVPSSALNNQIYYYTPTTPGTATNPAATVNLNNGSGILIVNNTSSNSWVKFSGTFTGLIVCNNCKFDQYAKVIGAVVSVNPGTAWFHGGTPTWLNPDDESKFSKILYSTEVLENLPAIAGAQNNSDVSIKHWIDNQNTTGRLTSTS